jgi:hypothetical protein
MFSILFWLSGICRSVGAICSGKKWSLYTGGIGGGMYIGYIGMLSLLFVVLCNGSCISIWLLFIALLFINLIFFRFFWLFVVE